MSLLNDLLYCPRRAALKVVEGWRGANEHTVRGDIVHEHADLPGYEVAKGVTVLRALPVWSDRLGLSGKCDVVEVQGLKSKVQSLESEDQGAECASPKPEVQSPTSKVQSPGPDVQGLRSEVQRPKAAVGLEPPYVGAYASLVPVEYKKGKRRAFENDDAQLCAQALCLEEMFGLTVQRGAVFHAASKRRREVEFTAELRKLTEDAITELHRLAASGSVPAAVFKPACEECSLFTICLPKATSEGGRAERAGRRLFET